MGVNFLPMYGEVVLVFFNFIGTNFRRVLTIVYTCSGLMGFPSRVHVLVTLVLGSYVTLPVSVTSVVLGLRQEGSKVKDVLILSVKIEEI